MLRRSGSGDQFEGTAGSEVHLFVAAVRGVIADARFEYGGVLATVPINGHPGCSFVVKPGRHQFRVMVRFDSVRYDLFQLDAGVVRPLFEARTSGGGDDIVTCHLTIRTGMTLHSAPFSSPSERPTPADIQRRMKSDHARRVARGGAPSGTPKLKPPKAPAPSYHRERSTTKVGNLGR